MQVALATHAGLPALDPDEAPFLAALAARGHRAVAAVWNDPRVDWSRFDALLVRSCWDYHLAPDAFRAWLGRLDELRVPVWNPTELARWNLDKGYLLELEARGVAIVPTRRLEPGEGGSLTEVMRAQGWDEAVVKPAISMSAYETWRASLRGAPAHEARFAALRARGPLLVQRYVPEVALHGESSLVFLGGVYSHALLKRAARGDFRVQADFGGTRERFVPEPEHLRWAQRALELLPRAPLYARFDGVQVEGGVQLVELELIDPELFFRHEPSAAPALVSALERACERA